MTVLRNIGLLATCRPGGGPEELHPVRGAAVAWEGEEISWVGPESELPDRSRGDGVREIDAGGRLVVPGLVDCHTHLAFGGWRAEEFEARVRGASYREIAREGGGILSTVRSTREAAEDGLVERCRGFLARMRRLGVTTVEAKSGYGLDRETELRLLSVYRRLREGPDAVPETVIPTFLGAHAVPPEFEEDRAGYLDLLTEELIPEVARTGLATACDVFVEEGAFSVAEARAVLEAAREHGLDRRLHADQLSAGGGAELAAEVGARSADHLEHASDAGVQAMAEAGVVAVDLPLASLYLDGPPMDARRFLDRGAAVAVATDFNPGTAPSYHLPLAMTLACTRSRLPPAAALKGATLHAARAAGVEERAGSVEPGKRADLAVIDAPNPVSWLYHHRPNACVLTVTGGCVTWRDDGERTTATGGDR